MATTNVNDLIQKTHGELVPIWIELFASRPPKRLSATLMRRILAHEIQARAGRGFVKRKQDRLIKLSRGEAREPAPGLVPGGRLIREWNGATHEVEVLDKGFAWRGQRYRSLSAIAEAITGTRWSGPRFFGLSSRKEAA